MTEPSHPRSSQSPPASESTAAILSLRPSELGLTATIGKYQFLGALGHGGMADVFLTMASGREGFRKLCVVKMLRPALAEDSHFREMFVDEARLAARLSHPNIVQTYEVEESGGHLLLAMEYIEGQPMSRLMQRMKENFPLTARIRVLCDILSALSYAHELRDFDSQSMNLVHRDISPQNIVVGYNGAVKLLDFGIAKSSAALQNTQAGVVKGKAAYMAPEQASLQPVDRRADLFSVGVILWECIAGRRLMRGLQGNDALSVRVSGAEPSIEAIVPDVDPALAKIVRRALENSPNERYPTAESFHAELEAWLEAQAELPRRTWAARVAAEFEPERKQLQDLIGQYATTRPSVPPQAQDSGTSLTQPQAPQPQAPQSLAGQLRAETQAEPIRPHSLTPSAHTSEHKAAKPRQKSVSLWHLIVLGGLSAVLVTATAYGVFRARKPSAHTDRPAASVAIS
jgi:serine/threonine protein kinase